jgi:hypothetical protein
MQDVGLNKKNRWHCTNRTGWPRARLPRHQSFVRSARCILLLSSSSWALHLIPLLFLATRFCITEIYIKPLHKSSAFLFKVAPVAFPMAKGFLSLSLGAHCSIAHTEWVSILIKYIAPTDSITNRGILFSYLFASYFIITHTRTQRKMISHVYVCGCIPGPSLL